ncbi:MAG TPA: class I SAM-dependent methyltransferase [Terracidiphilus sp.]|nr:class I SAM-dependent methyltransferase [Terracidiphilus sp.]
MTTLAMPKPRRDSGMEGMVAKWYASNTAEMMKEYVDLARRIAGELPQGSTVLEVAPGPGYFSIELARLGNYTIAGLDISHTFVKMAAKKAAAAGVKVDFKQGSASKMPLMSNSFDFLLCRAAFKNFANPVEALREMCRVLKPGGRGLIIDLKGDASKQELGRAVDGMGLSTFNRVLTKLAFKTMLLKRAYTRQQFEQMLAQTEFAKVEIAESDLGLEIAMTK